jgi:DNA-binding FadR family transcriptional regulator
MTQHMPQASDAEDTLGRRSILKLEESVAWTITRDVVDNGIEPGEMLPAEAEMIETYQVGRSSMREALRILDDWFQGVGGSV